MQRRPRTDCYGSVMKGIWFRLEEFKYSEGSEILSCLKRLASQSFLNIVGRPKSPESEQKEYYSQPSKPRERWHIVCWFSMPSGLLGRQDLSPCEGYVCWVCITGENRKLGESTTFALSSKQACFRCAGRGYLILQICLLQIQTW